MSILSEADADEYGVATQKKKKDEKDDFHRSKADQAFKDMHKVDVATEKDFETLGPITTKQHDDHKGNPSAINIGDATQQSPLKKFDMGGIGKSSYRKIDKTEGQKAMPKVDDGATKVLRIKEGSNFAKPGEKRWKQTSLSPQEAAAKHGKENVRVQKGRLRNGDDMVEVHVESVEQLDELSPKTLNSYATKAQPDIRRQSLDPQKRKKRAKMISIARYKAIKPNMNKG